jgi:hypothetical protein
MIVPAPQIPPRKEMFTIVPKELPHSTTTSHDPNQSFRENIERILKNLHDAETINFVTSQLKSAQRNTNHGDLLKQRISIIASKFCNVSNLAVEIPKHPLPQTIFREIVRASQQTDLSGIIETLMCSTTITKVGMEELLNSAEQNHTGATNILHALSRKGQSDEILYTGPQGRSAQEIMLQETQRGEMASRSRAPENAFNFLCTRCAYLQILSYTKPELQQEYNQALTSLKALLSNFSLRPHHSLYEVALEKIGQLSLDDLTLKFLKHDTNKLKAIWTSYKYKNNSFAQIASLLKLETPESLKNPWIERFQKLGDPILTKILTPKKLKAIGVSSI